MAGRCEKIYHLNVWHVSIVSSFPLRLETYSPFGPTRPHSSTPMFLAVPPKPRFSELGLGLNRTP